MKKSILLSAFTLLFLISGCCEKIELIGSPALQTYDVNVTEDKPFSVTYEVIHG